VRRGICLLNAGRYAEAQTEFEKALDLGNGEQSLPAYLASTLAAQGRSAEAAAHCSPNDPVPSEPVVAIRRALALWKAERTDEALSTLRDAVRRKPECAELHFQLGVILASNERFDEAELRFTQAVNIDRNHTESLVHLALCAGTRQAPAEALVHLRKAQAQRPYNARIGLLVAQAANAAHQQGVAVGARFQPPPAEQVVDHAGIETLSQVIATEPDFVDAFLSIPLGEVDQDIFAMLLETLQVALERQPEHAELHFHCGRVLARLGRPSDAIVATERAVEIEPNFVRALIELGRLYQQTDRNEDAATRWEQAIAAGAEYADVYYLLGNLYRDQGQLARARESYRHALELNDHYLDARLALELLPT
jgi:tetratricopeptide (TPR) repeat protein